MGSRNIPHHEPKKPKKNVKKIAPVTIAQAPVEVEVIGKGKKHREGEEPEEE